MLDEIVRWWLRTRLGTYDCAGSLPLKTQDYRKSAEEALEKAVQIIESDGWKKEKDYGNDAIYTKVIPNYGKVFKYIGTLRIPPEEVVQDLYFKIDEMHKWNPTVAKAMVVEKIDENVDVAHVITNKGGAGLVASRDFVNVRILKKQKCGYLHGTIGTVHPDVPEKPNCVRGEQGPGVYIITNGPTPEYCKMQWLLITDLKGWIPQSLLDQAISTMMIEYTQSLQGHYNKKKSGG